MEKEVVELFLNKKVVFRYCSTDNKIFENVGFLKKVTDTSIVVDFFGQLQAYSLVSITFMREFQEKK